MLEDNEISLEERRKRNIERNQSYLRNLFADNSFDEQDPSPPKVDFNNDAVLFSPLRKARKNKQKFENISSVITKFPCRELQIRSLCQSLEARLQKVKISLTFDH